MSYYKEIAPEDYMMLNDYISAGLIPLKPTQAAAKAFSRQIGWPMHSVIKIIRRFETVWAVADSHIQPSYICGMEFDVIRFPTGEYELKDGVQSMIMLECKRYIKPQT